MQLIPPPQRIIVKLKGNFNDKIKTENGKELIVNTTYNPKEHIRIDAEVVGVPTRIESNPIAQIYRGSPAPVNYANAPIRNLYNGGTKWVYAEETVYDVEVGDKVYFHFNSIDFVSNYNQTNRDSYLLKDKDGYEYHQLSVESVFGRVRSEYFQPLLGSILVKPVIADTSKIKIDGIEVDATLDQHGLIEKIGEKPKYLEGIIHYIGENVMPDSQENIRVADRILFRSNSEFKNKIEGDEYYVMKQWDVVAKYVGGVYVPLGKYVYLEDIQDNKLIIPKSKKIRFKAGKVLATGLLCTDFIENNDKVTYNSISPRCVNLKNNTTFVREEDIYYTNGKD